jgi:4-hydroxy-3-polyprenylbenzoate decarboxylase
MRIVVGISGASGAPYAIRLLEALKNLKVETHLVLTKAAERIIENWKQISRNPKL